MYQFIYFAAQFRMSKTSRKLVNFVFAVVIVVGLFGYMEKTRRNDLYGMLIIFGFISSIAALTLLFNAIDRCCNNINETVKQVELEIVQNQSTKERLDKLEVDLMEKGILDNDQKANEFIEMK